MAPRTRRSGTASPRREASYWVLKNDGENQGETFPAEGTAHVKASEKVCFECQAQRRRFDVRDAAVNQTKSLLWGTGNKYTSRCWIREVEEKKQSRVRGIGSVGEGLPIRQSGEGVPEKVTPE